ncbi:MAG TPA: hypothetical protein VFB48_01330, partial [Nitrososphaeraceae archaeon]|nr:hypothetical protein [Nitrososphaeraceae archaeon]
MHIIAPLIQQMPINDLIEVLLYVMSSALSIILIVFSITAYQKRCVKRLKYAIVAFSLFAGFLIYE